MLTDGSTRLDPDESDATLQSFGGPVDAATAAADDVVLWGDDDSLLACSAAATLVAQLEVRRAA